MSDAILWNPTIEQPTVDMSLFFTGKVDRLQFVYPWTVIIGDFSDNLLGTIDEDMYPPYL